MAEQKLVQVQVVVRGPVRVSNPTWILAKAVLDKSGKRDESWPPYVLEGGQFAFVGALGEVQPGDVVLAMGTWVDDSRWGLQLKVKTCVPVLIASERGFAAFLKRLPQVGEIRAREYLRRLGREKLRAILADEARWSELTIVEGINEERARAIQGEYRKQAALEAAFLFLAGLGIDEEIVVKALDEWEDEAETIVRANAYALMNLRVSFREADRIARGPLGYAEYDHRRLAAGAFVALQEATEDGHCWSTLMELTSGRTGQKVTKSVGLAAEYLRQGFSILETADDSPIVVEGTRIYDRECWVWETRLATQLARLNSQVLEPIELVEADFEGLVPDDSQIEAISACLGTVAVTGLKGGPGTGKSWCTKVILNALKRVGKSVLLCAPTGAAAQRLKEAAGHPASTEHRMLGFNPAGGFMHDEGAPLDADVVGGDEQSMTDIELMSSKAAAIRNGGRLILIGDVEQLPPVGPGQPLSDMDRSALIPFGRLTKIHRQASDSVIPYICEAIKNGELPGLSDGPGFMFQEMADPVEIADTIVALIRDGGLIDPNAKTPREFTRDEITVITPQKAGDVGVESLNRRLQMVLNPGDADSGLYVSHPYRAREGDRIIHRRPNIKDIQCMMKETKLIEPGVFNGEMGHLIAADFRGLPERELAAVGFRPKGMEEADLAGKAKYRGYNLKPGGATDIVAVCEYADRYAIYTKQDVRALHLGYAITTHSSQGKSLTCVILPMHESHQFMLDRGNIYTSISRTREFCLCLGQREVIARAARSTWRKERRTSLGEKYEQAKARLCETPTVEQKVAAEVAIASAAMSAAMDEIIGDMPELDIVERIESDGFEAAQAWVRSLGGDLRVGEDGGYEFRPTIPVNFIEKSIHTVKERATRLCPVCGESITLDGRTKDGRTIGSCGDAFPRWALPKLDEVQIKEIGICAVTGAAHRFECEDESDSTIMPVPCDDCDQSAPEKLRRIMVRKAISAATKGEVDPAEVLRASSMTAVMVDDEGFFHGVPEADKAAYKAEQAEQERKTRESEWVTEKVRQEEELGELPPGGASGGAVAKYARENPPLEGACEACKGKGRAWYGMEFDTCRTCGGSGVA